MTARDLETSAEHVRRFGSPAYVYDIARIRTSHAQLRAAIPAVAEIAYSLKANPHPALVRELGELGCELEVSSVAELAVASESGRPVIFTGPGKSDLDLEMAVRGGCVLSVESPAELSKVAAAARSVGVDPEHVRTILRINPDAGLESSGITMAGQTHFGFSAANAGAWRAELERTSLEALGYHVYGGSNIAGVDGLATYFRAAADCMAEVNSVVGLNVRLLDLGGGFPAPYACPGTNFSLDGLRERLEDVFAADVFGSGSDRPRIIVESGRYLTATSGTLFATVRDVKRSANGTRFVVLDAGVNHLGGMAALRRLPSIVAIPAVVSDEGTEGDAARLVGPLCTPLDVLNTHALLPDRLSVGDMLAIPNVGAYGLTASLLGFLSRELPVEIVVEDAQLLEATRLTFVRTTLEAEG